MVIPAYKPSTPECDKCLEARARWVTNCGLARGAPVTASSNRNGHHRRARRTTYFDDV